MRILLVFVVAVSALCAFASPGRAQLALNRLILEFEAGNPQRQDIEVSNTGEERLFVAVEPTIVRNPGTDDEQREAIANPEELGLLVTPNRMILEPGQTRLLRVAPLPREQRTDRVYRIGIRPVVGRTRPEQTGLRVVVGYQVLAMVRPDDAEADIQARREGGAVVFRNEGNSNALLFNGEQCDAAGENCVELPAHRLYAGNEWRLQTRYDTPVVYYVQFKGRSIRREF